jgi:hypothetical protein
LAGVQNVQRSITTLGDLETQSKHLVGTNAEAARVAIQSLNGQNTSSTHTITVRKVEANASGGLVGAGAGTQVTTSTPIAAFAGGGSVDTTARKMSFPAMRGGKVPGSGNADTVPRLLDAGSYVLKKVAVRKYGDGMLSQFVYAGQRVRAFAMGGYASISSNRTTSQDNENKRAAPKRNRDGVELLRMIDLGMESMRNYTHQMQTQYGAALSVDFGYKTLKGYQAFAEKDRLRIHGFIHRKTLTGNERQDVESMRQRWRTAMAQMLLYNKDYERELIDYMESLEGNFLARGGQPKASSDTVPAMLTPGEYVVRKDVVDKVGVGFFERLNNLSLPTDAFKQRVHAAKGVVKGYATGGLVAAGRVATHLASRAANALTLAVPMGDLSAVIARQLVAATGGLAPQLASAAATSNATSTAPIKTMRVELASGQRAVQATINAKDEAILLDILRQAQTRSV